MRGIFFLFGSPADFVRLQWSVYNFNGRFIWTVRGYSFICNLMREIRRIFLCRIHNYTEYNQQWNVFSAFNPSKCTHTWSSGQPTLRRLGSSWGFGALLKGLTSVGDNSCQCRDSNPQPRVTSPTLYPLGHGCPHLIPKLSPRFLAPRCLLYR